MKTPLRDAVDSRKEHISFHTPAHGGGIGICENSLPLSDDITELSYSGNLFSSVGPIAESEAEVSRVYNTDHTLFVTAGATAAVHTAVYALRERRFLVAGAAHKSVFSALRLSGAKAYYVSDTEEIESALTKTGAEVLIVTSPDYFGNILPLDKIAKTVKRHNTVLIIDASHGAHFVFHPKLPVSATVYGDIVIHSLHKTLPVLTGGALLHYKNELKERIFAAFSDTHTTSPSYPVMLSIEKAVAGFWAKGKELYGKVFADIKGFVKDLAAPFRADRTGDPTRLVISSPYIGEAVAEYLEGSGIFPETTAGNKVVFIVTPYNSQYLARLNEILKLAPALPLCDKEEDFDPPKKIRRLKSFSGVEFLPPEEAVGRRFFKEIGIYPPGIPLFFAGEIITREKAAFIGRNANRMFGLDKCLVPVVK